MRGQKRSGAYRDAFVEVCLCLTAGARPRCVPVDDVPCSRHQRRRLDAVETQRREAKENVHRPVPQALHLQLLRKSACEVEHALRAELAEPPKLVQGGTKVPLINTRTGAASHTRLATASLAPGHRCAQRGAAYRDTEVQRVRRVASRVEDLPQVVLAGVAEQPQHAVADVTRRVALVARGVPWQGRRQPPARRSGDRREATNTLHG